MITLNNACNFLRSMKRDKYRKPAPPIPSEVWQNPLYFFAFGFGSGVIPIAPGTWGTLLAIPFYLFFNSFHPYVYFIFVFVFIVASTIVCEKISNTTGIQDHPGMCIDEFAGFFVTMINVPMGLVWIISGFLLFRLFDIFKPWPIAMIDEKMHGGIGMILDDILAGVYAMVILNLFAWLSY